MFAAEPGCTQSHQSALDAVPLGADRRPPVGCGRRGSSPAASACPCRRWRATWNGLRLGTPEIVRRGVTAADAAPLAALIAEGLGGHDPAALAPHTAALRARFTRMRPVRA